MNQAELEELMMLMSEVIRVHGNLDCFWKKLSLDFRSDIIERKYDDLIPLLKKIIIKRIDVLNSFELLSRISPEEALAILESRYLGKNVSPDTKFGGYEFELSTMLSDLVEIWGDDWLKKMLIDKKIDPDRFFDSRVINSFCAALSCNPEELNSWIIEK